MKQINYFITLLLMLLVMSGVEMKAATAATASFDGTGDNVGKNLPFNYEFTTSGSNVTLTISDVDGTGIVGLDATPNIYDWTNGSEQSRGKVLTYTWESVTDGTTLKVRLNWAAANGIFRSDELSYTYNSGGGDELALINLTSGKTVVPLGGLKSFLPVGAVTEDNLQKITQDGNTDNVFLFPQNGENLAYNQTLGIQGFYIYLGESKSIGAIQSTWEGADCGANIYVTDTEPAADGTLTGATLIATFSNAQDAAKNVGVTVENSGRYIVFVPTVATNDVWGVKIRTFAAFEKRPSVLTSFEVNPSFVEKDVETELTLSPKDQFGLVLSEGVSYTVSSGTLVGNKFTANSAGNVTITATYGGVSMTATIVAVQGPDDVPGIITSFNDGVNNYTIESDQVTKVFTVDGNATGFVFQGPYNFTVQEAVTINGKQAEKLTNFNTLVGAFNEVNISEANYLHVDVYPMEDVSLVVYHSQSNQIGQKYNITAGQWNSIDIPVSSFNTPTATNTFLLTQNMTAEGKETHTGDIADVTLYLGNYYYFKTANVPDTEAPVVVSATTSNIGTTTATLTVRATDNKAGTLTYNIYNGSTSGTLLTTATGSAGENTVVNLTGLTQGGTYNLVVTATDAASNTSASMAVAEFTTLNYIPTLTTLQVVMKGESTDAFNTSNTGNFERIIRVIALDQKGLDMPSRQVKLRVTDGNTGTNDISFVLEQPYTVVKDGTNGSTSIRVNNHVGRVTVEAVDVQTGKTGYAFLTFYDARNTAATNEDQLISDPNQVSSAKISGASTSIITIAADGHGTNNYVSDGEHPAEFVVDWSSIQDNQQHYEYYDIDMIQVLYQQGKFPSDYTIAVSHDGGETYEDRQRARQPPAHAGRNPRALP